jgi:hypothetical protein
MATKLETEDSDSSSECSDAEEDATASANLMCNLPVITPSVIKFAFNDFTATGNKWVAKCKGCGVKLTESRGVTSGFTK